jgi:Raf kinase inhibitor-like YbhB/YbcL family protein
VIRQAATTCTSLIGALALIATLAGCDTDDGKQLKAYDLADYPSQAIPPTTLVADEFIIDPSNEGFTVLAPWADGTAIDPRYTCDGANISPAIGWSAVPAGTVDVALVMVDDSAVSDGQPFVHWVIGGLDPTDVAVVDGDIPPGALQALNFFGDVGYGGPCPPPGAEPHLYRLTVYALGQQLELTNGDLATEFLDIIATTALASTDVTGFYQR